MTAPRPTVLLVDDEPHSLAAMRMVVEDECDCLTADETETALRLTGEDWVQMVTCDQRMPGQTGVDFLTDVRERRPDCGRVIITGDTDPAKMVQAIDEAGIHPFLTKPWHPDQLTMAARNGSRLFQLAPDNDRMALELPFLAATVQTKPDKRRAALPDGTGFDTLLRSPHNHNVADPSGRVPEEEED